MDSPIKADYYSEVTDEKLAGTIFLRRDTVVAVYSIPGNGKRSMILTDQGLKFCLKGKPDAFITPENTETVLNEAGGAPV